MLFRGRLVVRVIFHGLGIHTYVCTYIYIRTMGIYIINVVFFGNLLSVYILLIQNMSKEMSSHCLNDKKTALISYQIPFCSKFEQKLVSPNT